MISATNINVIANTCEGMWVGRSDLQLRTKWIASPSALSNAVVRNDDWRLKGHLLVVSTKKSLGR